ncbi:Uncharacterised protein [Mycobacteroides abscessus subsp. abscessus]|nr:Uncharacterised protein [Mycobacteroides abscessus subsp. abscessus]
MTHGLIYTNIGIYLADGAHSHDRRRVQRDRGGKPA